MVAAEFAGRHNQWKLDTLVQMKEMILGMNGEAAAVQRSGRTSGMTGGSRIVNRKKAPKQEWSSRREIPNPQIKDSADQYESARQILQREPPGAGVLLPLMNVAAMAIELYLKSLSAEVIHVQQTEHPGWSRVHATAEGGHRYNSIFLEIDTDIRHALESSFADEIGGSLEDQLNHLEGALVQTRYSYERGNDGLPNLRDLMTMSDFLSRFVSSVEPRESIRW